MDLCKSNPAGCLFNQYKDYCFDNYEYVLSLTNYGRDDFITLWTTMVANEFGLSQPTLEALYYNGWSEPYMVDSSTRDFYKFASSNQVSGTPTAFINGVKLVQGPPTTVNGWLYLLENVYQSQYMQQ